jgi:hypothetical protein
VACAAAGRHARAPRRLGVLAARRRERIDTLAGSIVEAGGRAVAVRTDVEALVRRAVEEFGRLDVLVNNAGVARLGRLDVADWAAMVDVNVLGLLHRLAAALPVFRRQGHGHVVTTVSTAGLTVSPTMAVYAATKNAARTIMAGLRTESTDGVVRTTERSHPASSGPSSPTGWSRPPASGSRRTCGSSGSTRSRSLARCASPSSSRTLSRWLAHDPAHRAELRLLRSRPDHESRGLHRQVLGPFDLQARPRQQRPQLRE